MVCRYWIFYYTVANQTCDTVDKVVLNKFDTVDFYVLVNLYINMLIYILHENKTFSQLTTNIYLQI